ncbi:hypothetical protein EKO04_011619 [Ascochyta lentis]|uniref:Uncharacterized protein n=1 Tax=Ascochyta lentis TaxID=205686 RepID=A0A8H7ITT9_9PLEO|nr:hypothetical protein EKO04_011619 [Ascochyta lentis]
MSALTLLQSKLDDNTQAGAKRGQLHDVVTQLYSPKRQLRTSLSLHAPNMASDSTMVSSQFTASHQLSAELADTLAPQTWDGENQMQNSGYASQTDMLGGFNFGYDTQPNMALDSTMVSSQFTASHRLSAELADTLAPQTWDGKNQMQNSGYASQTDMLGGFNFGYDTQPNMALDSTMVSSQSTASHRLSAELADTLALQTWDGKNQMQNSGYASQTDKLGGFNFGHDTQPNDLGDFDLGNVNSPHTDSAIRMMLEQYCNNFPEDPQSAANNMEGYHTPSRIPNDVLQHRSQRSLSESSTYSFDPDEPYPSVETSRGSTRQSSVSTSIATEAQNIISRIRDQVLECQNDPVWFELPPHIKARLTARFTSILESCSIPVTTPHKAQTPNRRKQNANKVSSPGSSKRSNADLWYAKFMTVQVAAQKVPDAIQHYLNQPASVFLNPPAVMDACEAMSRNISEAGRKSILAKRVAYMQTLSVSSIHLSILININCLFFFLLSHESLSIWKSKCQDAVAQKLWHTKLPSLFEMLHPGEPMEYLNTSLGRATKTKKYQDFSAQVRGWQKRGSQLAYFVQQVGFGSIVLLHEQLEKPYGLSRGLESVESSGIFANRKPSEVAFQHLHDGGILQVGNSTGATEFLQRILLELFQGFDEWRNFGGEFGFPGFEQVEL